MDYPPLWLRHCSQPVLDRFKLLYVPFNYFLRTVQAVMIPTPAVSDLQTHIALLNTVLGTCLEVMSLPCDVYFDMGNKRLNRHRIPPLSPHRECHRTLGKFAQASRARNCAVVPFPY